MTRILLHSTQPVLTAGFEFLLSGVPEFQLSAVSTTVPQLIEMAYGQQPELILIELTTDLSIDTLRALASSAQKAKIVLWVESITTEFVSQAITMGVRGILRRSL
jgi:DNA-binding NarL/FixJ family response regulator